MELQEKLKQLTPEQQAKLTERINSGQLWERAQAGLDKFQSQQGNVATPTPQEPTEPIQEPTAPTSTVTSTPPQEPAVPTPTPTQEPTKITNIEEFKQAWANLDNLQSFIENRFWVWAEIQGNKVTAQVDWKNLEWTIDSAWNPSRKEVPLTPTQSSKALENQANQIAQVSQKEKEAQEMGISFSKRQDGTLVYKPDTLDDVFALYAKYGDSVKLAWATTQEIKGGILYNRLKNKLWVDKDTLVSSLKNWEIAYGEETWDYLTKLNGGVTPEMLEAKKEYEKFLDDKKTIELQNDMFDILEWKEVDSWAFYKWIMESMNNMFTKQEEQFRFINSGYDVALDEYKAKQTETNSKFSKMNDLQTELETLTDERDDVIRNVKKQYPNLDYSTQLLIAQNQTMAIDDAIKIKNREYTNSFRSYEQARQIDLEIYQETVKNIDRDVQFMQQVFQNQNTQFQMGTNLAMQEFEFIRQTQREEMMFQRDVARQDQLFEREQQVMAENRKLDFQYKMAETEANMAMQYDYAVRMWDVETAQTIAIQREKFMMAWGKISFDANGMPVYETPNWPVSWGGLLWLLSSQQPVSGLSVPDNPNGTALLNAQPWTLIPTRLEQLTPWNPWGKECGEYVNDITGLWLGNSLQDKLSKMTNKWFFDPITKQYVFNEWNIAKTWVGDVVVWNPWQNKWGHTGIVIAEDWDMALVRSSNMKSDGKISDDWVSKNKLLWSTPSQVTYATQENDNLVKRLESVWISREGIANIYMSTPSALVKSWDLAFTGTNETELSFIKNDISKTVSETASKFWVNTPWDLITSLWWSLSRMSDEDIKLIQWGLIQSLMTWKEEEVTNWIKRQVQNGSDKNGLRKVQDWLPQIKEVASLVWSLKQSYDQLSDTQKQAFDTNIASGRIAQAKKILGMDTVYAELDQSIGFLRKNYQLEVSGQASTDAEFEAIAEFFPKVTNVNSLNQKLIEWYFNFYTKSSLWALESQLRNFNIDIYDLYPEIKELTSWANTQSDFMQRASELNQWITNSRFWF